MPWWGWALTGAGSAALIVFVVLVLFFLSLFKDFPWLHGSPRVRRRSPETSTSAGAASAQLTTFTTAR